MNDDVDNNWQQGANKLNEVTMSILKKHRNNIGAMASAGNECAKEVIKYYKMVYDCYDPLVLDESLDKWMKENVK